jgi:RNA polymerase sigma-70 factor, ECF subfamily
VRDLLVDSSPVPTLVAALPSVLRKTGAKAGEVSPLNEAGARPSLAELYDAYSDFVYRSLLSLGVASSHAEDAMQDVFLVANRHLSAFEGTFYKAWLFRLAHSIARNIRRSTKRTESTSIDAVELVDQRASPFEGAAQAEEVRLLHALLEHLDEGQREVFVLAELEQLPHLEIAAALGVHVNTVANRLHAARLTLERLLRRHHQGLASGTKV